MPNDRREARETIQVLLSWGMPSAERDDAVAGAAFWLAGGVTLLLWTALVLLLTAS